jgi:transposase-like protein
LLATGSAVSELNEKIYGKINEWRERPLVGEFPYVFLDGLWLKWLIAGPADIARQISIRGKY